MYRIGLSHRVDYQGRDLNKLILHFNLIGAHVLLHGTKVQYTWQQGRTKSRLHRVYVSSVLADIVTECEIVEAAASLPQISDHSPVGNKISSKGNPSNNQAWHLDTRILYDRTCKASLRNRIAASIEGRQVNDWDSLKVEWKTLCIDEGKKLRHRQSDELTNILKRIKIIERGNPATL
ncbi:hypothetical protein HPB48_004627 [Haemaphysalis longicornis]|uniref:Uncharacterized protein n=1 Tax=Haemaphysalis longicornis TaxID=44386 RepID=A0A9J6GK79_HAELO|nr:hypothetical protein HPB48_004627 [Haemaphysalis longicornis]